MAFLLRVLVNLRQLPFFIVEDTLDQVLSHAALVLRVQLNGSHLLIHTTCRFVKEVQVLGEGHIDGNFQSSVAF